MSIPKQIISYKNIGRKPPTVVTLVFILFIREFNLLSNNISAMIVGAISLLFFVMWVMYFVDLFKYDEIQVDVFTKKDKV